MRVTVSVVGGADYAVDVTDETYADLLDVAGLNPHEAAVLVDGRPVPEDQPVAASEVEVVRLVRGG